MNTPKTIPLNGDKTYSQEVVGESKYQDVFEAICGKKRTEESVRIYVDALIIPEPNNPYDPNAYKVTVKGKTVGYLPRQFAKILHDLYIKYNLPNDLTLSTKAMIKGGWERDGIKGHYGIWLDMPVGIDLENQLTNKPNNTQLPQNSKNNTRKKRSLLSTILIVIIITCSICIISSLCITIISPSSTKTSQPVTIIPASPKPTKITNTPKPTNTTEPTSTARIPGIPGIMPADVTLNLKQRKFTCTNVKEVQAEGFGTWYLWTCDRDERPVMNMHVEIMSRTISDVDTIEATIIQYYEPNNEIAASFLGYMATFAFIDNSDLQQSTKTWVEQTLPTIQKDCVEKTINGIYFKLCGPPTAHWIEIGNMD